jgi:hypothetical protein
VDRLDYGGELDELFVYCVLALPTAKEDERGADTLAARVDAVFDVFADFGFETVDLIDEKGVESFQMRL